MREYDCQWERWNYLRQKKANEIKKELSRVNLKKWELNKLIEAYGS
jgi:hypothetical protein